MHDSYIPHCSYCENFVSSFYTDMVTEWGYCEIKVGDNAPTRKETNAIKNEVKAGNYQPLKEMQDKGILFVPTEIDCDEFIDAFPE